MSVQSLWSAEEDFGGEEPRRNATHTTTPTTATAAAMTAISPARLLGRDGARLCRGGGDGGCGAFGAPLCAPQFGQVHDVVPGFMWKRSSQDRQFANTQGEPQRRHVYPDGSGIDWRS